MNPRRESKGSGNGKANPVARRNLRVVNSVSYSDIDNALLSGIVQLVTKHGAAVMFGVTSDQGAYSVLVLDNQNKIKEYPHDAVDMNNLFTWLRDEYFGDEGPLMD